MLVAARAGSRFQTASRFSRVKTLGRPARRAGDGCQGLSVPGSGDCLSFFPARRADARTMPSTWTQNYYHAVFSTKHRVAAIAPEIEARLYPFMGGIVRDLRSTLVAINGMPDHVHLLIRYRADISHSQLLQQIKGRSSKWINDTFGKLRPFAWQEGYGGFTVSRSMVPDVEAYIARQKDHHKRHDFRSEFLELLRRHGIECNEDDVFQ